MASGWLDSQGLRRNMTGKLGTRNLACRPLWMGKECRAICIPCECLPKGDLCRGEFLNNQVDRMTCSVATSQPLSPGPLVIAHGPMFTNTAARWQGRRLCMGWVTQTSIHRSQPGRSNASRVPNLPAVETQTESRRHSPVIRQLPHGRLITLDYFHHGKDSVLLLLEQTLTLDMDLLSLHIMLLPKLPSVGFQNAFSTVMVFHTALF